MPAPSFATIPEGLDQISTPDGCVIRKRWFSWSVIPLAIFTTVWDGFIFFFYVAMFRSSHHPSWPIFLFPLAHVAVGVGLTYSIFTTLFNRTEVRLSSSGVQVFKGPLPWMGNRTIGVGEMSEVSVRTRTAGRGGQNYSVMYVDRDRKERPLLAGVAQSDQAEFIAATVRQRLGLRVPAA